MDNPSLREEPIDSRAATVPMTDTLSILDWLRTQGRLIDRQAITSDLEAPKPTEDISLLMGEDSDDSYEDEE